MSVELWNLARVRLLDDGREGVVLEADLLVVKALIGKTHCSCGCGVMWLFDGVDGDGRHVWPHEVELLDVVDQLAGLADV